MVLACGGGEEPSTYEECLLDLGRSRTARETRSLCREAFPSQREEQRMAEGSFSGTYYYTTTGPECGQISINRFGEVSGGFCGTGSRIECGETICELACLRVTGHETAMLATVTPSGAHLLVTPYSAEVGAPTLYSTRSACELEQGRVRASRASQDSVDFDSLWDEYQSTLSRDSAAMDGEG